MRLRPIWFRHDLLTLLRGYSTALRMYCRHLQHFQNNRDQPALLDSEPNGGGTREVDDPRFYKRAAIVYPNHNAAVPIKPPHSYSGTEGQCPMSGSKLVLIVDFAAR